MDYFYHILVVVCIYAVLANSLNLLTGYTGLLSLAHAAFFGIGAYSAGLLALNAHMPFFVCILCAMVVAGILGLMVGLPSLRVRDDYLAITTFAFQILAFGCLNNWVSLTGGPQGLNGIPRPAIFGIVIASNAQFLVLTACVCSFTYWVVARIVRSPFGRVLKAIREDEIFAQSLGKNVAKYKLTVFVISSCLAALIGAVYAFYIVSIDPTGFTVMESIFIVSILIIGGAGSLWGPFVGAVVLVVLPEVLRQVGLPEALAANSRQILYGILLVTFMMWRPQGLFGEYKLGSSSREGK
ncbi:MAG: branched-chain amino acid ABC transporter permease [Armatimonadetes bacterium]|nr:branched-chain amino acid ABC transporter permease [Armatimonadota bacterium]